MKNMTIISPLSAMRQEQFKLATGWIALIAVGLAIGLAAQMVIGSYFTTPNFWDLPHLVHLAAECLMLFFVLFACCSPAGYGWFLWAIILDMQMSLLWAYLRQLKRIPPAYVRFSEDPEPYQPAAVRATQARLQAQSTVRRPHYMAAGKAPFLLFQQAPLLVAP